MIEFCEKFIHGFETTWIQGDQLILKLIDLNIIMFIKQGSEMVPNILWSLHSQDVENKILGYGQTYKSIGLIQFIPVFYLLCSNIGL